MRGLSGPRLLSAAALVLVMLVPVACAPLAANWGGDPCLLQQYQGHSYGIINGIQGALGTLTQRADALAPTQGSINASQDISETLTAISEFHLALVKQQTLMAVGAQPPNADGQTFQQLTGQAIQRFQTGAQLLAQAYTDASYNDPRPTTAVVVAARDWMHQGRLLLSRAGDAIAGLHTYSPNC